MLPQDAQSYYGLQEDQCAEFCERQNCRAFEMVGSRTCIVSNVSAWMTGRNGYESLVQAPGSRYYERPKHNLDLFTRIPGVVYRNDNKYDKLLNLSEAEECAKACVTTPGFSCNSFAYSHENNVCALSAGVIRSPNDLKEVKNYDTFEYSGDWPCNVTLLWGYSPRVISTSKYPFHPRMNKTCTFNLVAPPGESIVLTILTLFINRSVCSEGASGVFIYDGNSDQSPLMLRLCKNSPELLLSSLKSSGNIFIKIATRDKPFVVKIIYDYTPHDACDGHRCRNGGSCLPNINSYTCACLKEFSGTFCETDIIDDCESNPCIFGICFNKFQNYECQCYNGVTGKRCETFLGSCSSDPCKHGVCVPTVSDFHCVCAAGFTGRKCEYEINECFSSPCGAHGHCIDKVHNYTCVCESGYTGRHCHLSKFHKSCADYECKYGTCAVNQSGSFCQCFPGFTGLSCDINTDECSDSPCGSHGRCLDHVNGYSCQCHVGWYGAHCNISKSDSCRNSNCVHGYCSVISPSGNYKCICEAHYTGSQCNELITPCSPSPCVFGECIELGSNFECKCKMGHNGRYCDEKISYCENNSCVHGKCVEGAGNFSCVCDKGWTSEFCDVRSNHCVDVNCHLGKCEESFNDFGFKCICDSNHTGQFCERIKNPCLSIPCRENGTCSPNGDIFTCQCDSRRTGSLCEHLIEHCQSSPCVGGRCIDHADSYLCICDVYHTGRNCETILKSSSPTRALHWTTQGTTSAGLSKPHVFAGSTTGFIYVDKPLPSVSPSPVTESDLCKGHACRKGEILATTHSTTRSNFVDKTEQSSSSSPAHIAGPETCKNHACSNGEYFTTSTVAIVTKLTNTKFTTINQQISGKITSTVLHTNNNTISNHVDKTVRSTQMPTFISANSDKFTSTEVTLASKHHMEVTLANKVKGNQEPSKNNNNTTNVIKHNEKNMSTVTELNKFIRTDVTQKKITNINCNGDTCVHGRCKLENNTTRCQCDDGFVGKFCNMSVLSASETTLYSKHDSDGRVVKYVAIAAVCLCLLILIFGGGYWWYKRVKRQRGSVYISNPMDFETKDTISNTTEEEDMSEKSVHNVRENSFRQAKPISRCAWYLNSGTSNSSNESKQETNICNDANVHFCEKSESMNNNLSGDLLRQTINGFDETVAEHSNDLTHQVNRDRSISVHPSRPILIRPPDKRYMRFPGFQTINGVQKGKSEV